MDKLKIAVSGIGGVGGYYGGLLSAFYEQSEEIDIYFIARGKNLEAIRKNGLLIKEREKQIHTYPTLATDKAEEIGIVDFLFCCSKSYDLEKNIEQLRPVIGAETVVVPLLNGVDITERIQKILPDHHVWKGCCYIVSRQESPGIIIKSSPKDFLYFGDKESDKMRQRLLLVLLANAGIAAFNPEDIDMRIWMKYVMISTTATITSYYNLPIGGIISTYFDEYVELIKEIQQVASGMGIQLPDDIIDSCVKAQQLMPEESTTSMHTDFIQGNDTELETLTGYVVHAANNLNIDTPLYNKMYDKLRG